MPAVTAAAVRSTSPAIQRLTVSSTFLGSKPGCAHAVVHLGEARGVPELGGEVAVALHHLERELDVAPLRRHGGQREAQRVGAVGRDAGGVVLARVAGDAVGVLLVHQPVDALLDQPVEVDAVDDVQGVHDVALGLGHLLPALVADEGVDVDVAERDLLHEVEPHHQHARDPEEDDVEAGDEHAGRIEPLHLLGLVGPAERGERPQGGGEPGVEDVGVAPDRHRLMRPV